MKNSAGRIRIIGTIVCILIVVCLILFLKPTGEIQDDNLIWHDEFDGDSLNMDNWDYRGLGIRRDANNTEDAIEVTDGNLIISTFAEDGQIYTGMIGTQDLFENTYGYYESRVKFQSEEGQWSAFWLQSSTLGQVIGDVNQSGAEIDIFEYRALYGEKVQHALHWDGYAEHHQKLGYSHIQNNLSTGWHVIGLDWTPDEYVFYVDGNETWRTSEAVSGAPQYIILSVEVSSWGGDISRAALPDYVMFDYVRVYSEKPK